MTKTSLVERARKALRGFAERVLDVDEDAGPLAQMELLEDYLGKFEFDTNVKEMSELMVVLKKKHLVDSICVASSNGSLIASTNGEDLTEALTGTALFNYVQAELPKSTALLVRHNGWYMVFPYKKKIFIIKALDSLSTPELKALADEVDLFLAKKGVLKN